MAKPVRVGIIGCGAISGAYLQHARSFPILDMAACADIDRSAAEKKALEFGVPKVCSVDELLKDDSIEIILNLTIPKVHAAIALRAIKAGKHTYSEKPLGINRAEGLKLIAAAKKRRVRVGCAPDTFMGAGIQTACKLLEGGAIGRPVAFTAFMMCPGHESWHPNPEFYYEVGGGPMFDMGPYYLTALLNMLGPVKQISGSATFAIPNRTITHRNKAGEAGPKFGKKMKVKTPDHISGTIEFAAGAMGTIITSFATRFPSYDGAHPITIFGTEGTLRVPDPNHFDGPVVLRRNDDADWMHMPHAFVKGYGRAVGLADMAHAIRSRRKHRASGEQAMSVLDLMQGFLDSARTGKSFKPKVKYVRPALMRADLPFGVLDG